MLEPLANWVIEYKDSKGRWQRYTTTWKEFVAGHIEEAKERGYKEVRARQVNRF